MKSFFVVLACLSASLAFGLEPKIGDKAVYEGSVFYADGSDAPLSITYEVIAINGESATILATRQQMAETQKFDFPIDLASLRIYSREALEQGCREVGGTFENVSVKAGTFEACTQSLNDEGNAFNVSVGSVPFGLIKSTTKEDTITTALELSSFQFGQ